MMSPLRVLADLGLAQWSTIIFGFEKHWFGREEIFEYAMSQLLIGCESEHTAIIAGGGNLSDEELFDIISKQTETVNCAADVDRWRLAFLHCIEMSNGSEENKISRLQEIYADFDYPEDMTSCSIYSQDSVDPLAAMNRVINKLRKNLLPQQPQ